MVVEPVVAAIRRRSARSDSSSYSTRKSISVFSLLHVARPPSRTPRNKCSRVSSLAEPPRHTCREPYGNEQVGGIYVVLAGFVDDPNVPLPIGFTVWQHLIDLSRLKVLHAAVFHAECERTTLLLNSHNLSPGSALSSVLACPRRELRTSGSQPAEAVRLIAER